MLVLSRKTNESIVIGNNITVQILKIKGNTIRLGITAPRDVPVRRSELPTGPTTATPNVSAKADSHNVSSDDDGGDEMYSFECDIDDLSTLPNPFIAAATV